MNHERATAAVLDIANAIKAPEGAAANAAAQQAFVDVAVDFIVNSAGSPTPWKPSRPIPVSSVAATPPDMLARVEFSIPGRPTAWARTGGNVGADGRGARRFTPHKQRKAMHTVQRLYTAHVSALRLNRAMLTGALKLEILCVYDIPVSWSKSKQEAARRGLVWKTSVPDWDNLGKLVGDALNRHAYQDDAAIAVASVAKRYGAPERTVIRLTELEPWEDALRALGLPGQQESLAV